MVTTGYKWLLIAAVMLLTGGFLNGVGCPEKLPHPFYISVTEMNYNETSGSLEISCKVFTDDLQTALGKIYTEKPDLFLDKNKALANKQIAGYLGKHLSIKIDGQPFLPNFLGFERENEAAWSYLEATHTPEPKTIEITNSILYDSFNQQINLVHVTVKGQRKSAKLQYPESALTFTF